MNLIEYLKGLDIDATLEKYQTIIVDNCSQNDDNPIFICEDVWRIIIEYLDLKNYCNILHVCRFFYKFRDLQMIKSIFRNEIKLNGRSCFNEIRKNWYHWLFKYTLIPTIQQQYFIIKDSNDAAYICTIQHTLWDCSVFMFQKHITIYINKDYTTLWGIDNGDILKINKVRSLDDESDIDVIRGELMLFPSRMHFSTKKPKRKYRSRKKNKRIKI